VKRPLLLPSPLREFLEVLGVFLKVFRLFLKVLRVFLKVFREILNSLGHLCDLQCEFSQLRGELGRFDGWCFDTWGNNDLAHNFGGSVRSVDLPSGGIVKLVDLPGELAKAKQIESGNVSEESHLADGSRFGSPGLLNDPFDLILGTESLRHSYNVDRDLQGMSSC
jgi:hypothetical protein